MFPFALFVHVFSLRLAGGIIDLREGEYEMGKEHVDPAFSYTDANIKKLKKELSKELGNLQDSLLETQRSLALLQVRVSHNESLSYTEVYSKSQAQFSSEVTSAFLKIDSSNQPLAIAQEFVRKRWGDLKELGIKSIEIER